jgi:hypothetical protein
MAQSKSHMAQSVRVDKPELPTLRGWDEIFEIKISAFPRGISCYIPKSWSWKKILTKLFKVKISYFMTHFENNSAFHWTVTEKISYYTNKKWKNSQFPPYPLPSSLRTGCTQATPAQLLWFESNEEQESHQSWQAGVYMWLTCVITRSNRNRSYTRVASVSLREVPQPACHYDLFNGEQEWLKLNVKWEFFSTRTRVAWELGSSFNSYAKLASRYVEPLVVDSVYDEVSTNLVGVSLSALNDLHIYNRVETVIYQWTLIKIHVVWKVLNNYFYQLSSSL